MKSKLPLYLGSCVHVCACMCMYVIETLQCSIARSHRQVAAVHRIFCAKGSSRQLPLWTDHPMVFPGRSPVVALATSVPASSPGAGPLP